jgi:hypothetical protein
LSGVYRELVDAFKESIPIFPLKFTAAWPEKNIRSRENTPKAA